MSLNHHNKNVLQSGDKSLQRQLNQDSHPPDAENISSNWLNENRSENLSHIPTHISHTQDAPLDHWLSCGPGVPDEIYGRLPPHRKVIILALLSFCAFLAPMSSTTILAAVPEVAADYNSTGTIINLSNALYMLFMGISPCFWGPLSQVYGRRWICLITSALFCACSLGTALSPNLASYFIFRILTAFEGTSFLTVGASCIGDIYAPQERGTAMGWFLSGTLIGPALGPFIGGIIVTFRSWRVIFYLQTALAGVALIGAFFLLPETAHHKKIDELAGLPVKAKAKILCLMLNPWRVVRLFKYPNLLVVGIAASSLIWNMYSLLTPIRYVLNPRFNLISPIQSGLFYLAPGCGYVLGTFFGGRYADYVTITWTAKRGGVRIPEDRLRSSLPFMGIMIPASMLLYGWSVEKRFGGIALPVIMMFLQGIAQLFCFPSLNTYCLDVMQNDGAEVIAGSYMIRYLFAAIGSATVLPAVERIGVGWFSTISAAFLALSSLATLAAILWGQSWRNRVEKKQGSKRKILEKEKGKTTTAIPAVVDSGEDKEIV